MTFIKEMVCPDNEEKYNSFGLKYDGKVRGTNKSTLWYVDRERDIYWMFLGGGALEHPQEYALIWKNKKVIIEADVRATRTPSGMKDHWYIKKIKASQELLSSKNELIEIMQEAINSMYQTIEVIFKEIPDITFVSEDRLNG